MTDMIQVTIDNEWEIIHHLSTGIFTFDLTLAHFKDQGRGHTHFDNEYL